MTPVPAGCPLTPCEYRAVVLLAEGLSYKEIAARLDRSLSTIRTQLHSAFGRLEVPGSAQAVILCSRNGWIRPLEPDPAGTWDELQQIKGLICELIVAVRDRSDRSLTRRQRTYLDAFDDHLYARSDEDKIATRRQMDAALGGMLSEAGVVPKRDRKRDLVELIAHHMESW